MPVIGHVVADFWFLRADVLRGTLGPLPPDLHRQRSVYEKIALSLDAAREGTHARDCLVVSHAWETALEPDPRGVQVSAV